MVTTSLLPFGTLLKRYRRTAGLTQEALAALAGYSAVYIGMLERGQRLPVASTLTTLTAALNLSQQDRLALEESLVGSSSGSIEPRPVDAPSPQDDPPLGILSAPSSGPVGAEATPFSREEPLPLQPTPLLGRAVEVAAVTALLTRPGVRLVTLTGPGGVGKTRLGVEAATKVMCAFPDGVVYVALASLGEPGLVASSVAAALGLREGSAPLEESVRASLRDKRVLLVMDNFEHLLAAAPVVARLLSSCAGLKALVTSRSVLRLRGEHEFAVQPLTAPDSTSAASPDALMAYPAVDLFMRCARAARPDLALTAANGPDIAAICRRLDGLPLAIELAAPRVKLLPPAALLARLDKRLPLLTGGPRDLPERQQTLRGAIAWSYDLLHAGEQALFRRLAVFAGGCTMEAVQAVCDAPGDLRIDVFDWLASLVDKSLLRRHVAAAIAVEDDDPRFGMLETIREYGLERLAESGEIGVVRRQHALYYTALAEGAAQALTGAEQGARLEQLDREHDNLRAALAWAADHAEGEIGLRLAGALWLFWYMRSYPREGLHWLLRLLELPEGDAMGDAVTESTRAKALGGAGALAWESGDYDRARTLCAAALALYERLGDAFGPAKALSLTILGNVALGRGDVDEAELLYERSLSSFDAAGDTWGRALALVNLGTTARYKGAYERAAHLCAGSLTLFRALDHAQGIARALVVLAAVACERGDLGQARAFYAESLTRHGQVRDRAGVALCVEGLARAAGLRGCCADAALLFGAADTLRAAASSALPEADRSIYDRVIAHARAELGDDRVDAAWRAGAAMTPEEIVSAATRSAYEDMA